MSDKIIVFHQGEMKESSIICIFKSGLISVALDSFGSLFELVALEVSTLKSLLIFFLLDHFQSLICYF